VIVFGCHDLAAEGEMPAMARISANPSAVSTKASTPISECVRVRTKSSDRVSWNTIPPEEDGVGLMRKLQQCSSVLSIFFI
jgi:hypothetical protein